MNTVARTLGTLAIAGASIALPLTSAHAATGVTQTTPFVPIQARVTATSLSVRTAPNTTATRVDTAAHSTDPGPVCSVKGQAVAGNTTWYWVQTGHHQGYASAAYVQVYKGKVPACSSFVGMKLIGAKMTTPTQVGTQLAATSSGFRSYAAKQLAAQVAWDKAHGTHCSSLEVTQYWGNDLALGGAGNCSGYQAVWTYSNGAWHTLATQGGFLCSDLRKAGVAHAIPGAVLTCAERTTSGCVNVAYVPR